MTQAAQFGSLEERILLGRGAFVEGETIALRARLQSKLTGSGITQAQTTSVLLRVYDRSSAFPDAEVYAETLVKAAVIFDTPQQDASWWSDSVGYTLKVPVDTKLFDALGGREYRVEVVVETTVDGRKTVQQDLACVGTSA